MLDLSAKIDFANLSLQTDFAILTKKKKNARKNQNTLPKLPTKLIKSTKLDFKFASRAI